MRIGAVEASADLFGAFADVTRLRIMSLLRTGDLCVGDLVTVLRVPQPTASRHLAYLRRAGLITPRKNGYWTFYTLTASRTPLQHKLIESLDCCNEHRLFDRDRQRLRRVLAKGGCCPK
jgi:ArsR family transcriptional regulator, arsenate/arsenite/antimonite-responsive transcriptional repressor